MHYMIVCRDAESRSAERKAALEAHRRHVDSYADRVVLSGPVLADDGDTRCGQLFVLDVADRSAAQRFVDDDPFARSGVFASIQIDGLQVVFRDGRRV